MSIKGFKRMHLHNMGHFRVRRVRVDHNEGGEYQDARENTPRGGAVEMRQDVSWEKYNALYCG